MGKATSPGQGAQFQADDEEIKGGDHVDVGKIHVPAEQADKVLWVSVPRWLSRLTRGRTRK